MFILIHSKVATSELVNIDNVTIIGHRKWHDSDDLAVTASFTADRAMQNTVFLTGPLSTDETEQVIENICGAIRSGIPILDLREYGDHAHARHGVAADHAVVTRSGAR